MKNLIVISILAFLVIGINYCYSQVNPYAINVSVTEHSCCPDDGIVDAERPDIGGGFPAQYNGPGQYQVTWNLTLENIVMTHAWAETIPVYCTIHEPFGPSVHMYCFGEDSQQASYLYPASLEFDIYLGPVETGSGGPPPAED